MLRIGSLVWGVTDFPRALEFWTAALGFVPREEADTDWVVLVPPDRSGMQFALQLVTSAGAKRHHLDLYADDQAAEIERLVGLGATIVEHWDYEDDADYVVLADPDGNPFCVIDASGEGGTAVHGS
jgi:catechol 2,3-dioxygenase-like lactoylglutathione lyase family enzyme